MTGPRFGMPPAHPDVAALPSHAAAVARSMAALNVSADGAPPSAGIPGATLQLFPWWLYEYPNAQDFYIDSLNFAPTASATSAVPNFSYTVPQQMVAVIKQMTLTVQNSLATINLRATLLLNGGPVPGWSAIAFPPVAATGVIVPFNSMVIRMDQGQTLTATFTEAIGTAYTCSIQLSGWQVPKTDVQRLQNGVNY